MSVLGQMPRLVWLLQFLQWHTEYYRVLYTEYYIHIYRAALTIGLGGAEAPGPEQGGGP